ncbi:acyltransferase family protein [Bdellovibrio svalbardensis]|uniref:Acyltransferase n=1 Tax=Bdellovibrio svalbardensis TaxID=2972972 RepID=A0ABT6DMG2_9BACT|nr:acyltransferase [Bdellovibrio svalbardensis]MDG0818062.1 acyltransferase [Bdellovibrio svalbardensis]
MQKKIVPLPALTSLRFFAALAILALHCEGYFGIAKPFVRQIYNTQPVSFFFVLSGFIMFYCYPYFERAGDVLRFYRARWSRIWPTHILAFIVAFLASHRPDSDYFIYGKSALESVGMALSNILLIQAWIPKQSFYSSYYSHSWSISTEFFFYLLFPVFVYGFARRWKLWLGLSVGLVLAAMIASGVFEIPSYRSGFDGLTTSALFHVNPVVRVFEFILGMTVGLVFTKYQTENGAAGKTLKGTLWEVGALILLIINMRSSILLGWSFSGVATTGVAAWLVHSGSCLGAAFLIYTFAKHEGAISQFLSRKFFVLLGEISFTLYMIHGHYMMAFRKGDHPLDVLPLPLQFPAYLFLMMVMSYVFWKWFEVPVRKRLLRS